MSESIYALLIGAEFYFPNQTPEGGFFESLKGCVRDVRRIEQELLIGRFGVPAKNILKLHASNHPDHPDAPPEPAEMWPTYQNIVRSFQQLRDMAPKGSQVYIHYSGHGGRTTTKFKEIKGPKGIDETLAPIDIEDVAVSRYVRDIELARLVREMVAKDLKVTLVLDSCHSGGMTRGRGSDIAVRGTERIDTRERPADNEPSLVATHEELLATWNDMKAAPPTRSARAASGWMPEANGYVMLAACSENESAVEYAFNGADRSGALTYWLLKALEDLGQNISWKQVHDRILAKINSQFVLQTPQIEGEVDRTILGLNRIPPVYAVRVLQHDPVQQLVQLNTGEALGAAHQAGYAIFPVGTTDFTKTDQYLGVVEISKLGASKSWARITQASAGLHLQGGEPAVMIDSGVISVRGCVRLVEEPPPPPAAERAAALQKVADAIANHGGGFLKQVGRADATNYQVAVSKGGDYEILDAQGAAFPHITPALKIADETAAEKVVERVIHLYRYHTIEQLKSPGVFSMIGGKLTVDAFKAPPDAKQMTPPPANQPLAPVETEGGVIVVKPGESIYLRIKNDSQIDLNIGVLDLDSDWSVTQVAPPKSINLDSFPLEKGKEVWPILTMNLSHAGDKEARSVLKVIATIGPVNLRVLELPTLDEEATSLRSAGWNPTRALEELFANFNDDRHVTRSAAMEMSAGAEWTVAEIAVRIRA